MATCPKVLLLMIAAGCSTEPAHSSACEAPPAGAFDGTATRRWSIATTSGATFATAVVAVDGGVLVAGTYRGGLELGARSLLGDGTFLARVDSSGTVLRLARISEQALEVNDIAVDATRIVVLVDTDAGLEVVAVDDDGAASIAWTIRGAFDHAASVTSIAGRLGVTGTVVSGGARAEALALEPMEDAFSPGHAVALTRDTSGTESGWIVDGDAGSRMRFVDSTAYAVGRFGGFGPVVAQFGETSLVAVSSDDDPAYDAFVARRDGNGVAWAERIRAYASESTPPPAAAFEDDLVVSVSVTGYDIVFREGKSDEVRVELEEPGAALARYASDGSLRWAQQSALLTQLWSSDCALWGLESTMVGAPGSALVRYDGDGRLLGRRSVADGESATTWVLTAPAQWVVATQDFQRNQFALEGIEW